MLSTDPSERLYKPFLKDAVFLPSLNTYILKNEVDSNDVRKAVKLRRLRKVYGNKIVQLTEDGFINIKKQIKLLPFCESLMDIRRSRVYKVLIKNIRNEGILIKGLTIPFNYLKFVHNESRRENQKQD